jgi:hypothetical protein
MNEERQLIYRVLLELGKSPEEAERLSSEIDKITQSANRASKATEDFSKAAKANAELQKNQARSSGLAGAAAFELGRTISDLPFGIVAVTNNISQLGTLMAALVANAKGLRNALALLKNQLTGPAGILIAFQVVVAAITFLSQRSNKAKKDLNDLNNEIASSTSNLLILKKAIDEQSLSFERLSILVREANDDNKNLNLSLKESEESYRTTSQQIREYVKALELAARVKAVQSAIEDEFKIILKEQDEQAKSTVASYNFIGRAYANIKGAIVDFYQGISGAAITSEAKISESQFRITQLMIELERLFAQGFTGDPKKAAEEGADEIADLQERLALLRIKIEENRLRKELEFIDEKLKKEKEGEEEYLKLQIRREQVLDSLRELAEDRAEEEEDRRIRLRELEEEIILASISDNRERLKQQIIFIDQEMSKQEEGTVKYRELQLEKIKAVNALADAEKKAQEERIKEDERVNSIRAKLFAERIAKNQKLNIKWLKSQINSLEDILSSEKISAEQRAQAEYDLFKTREELQEQEKDRLIGQIEMVGQAANAVFDVLTAQVEREIALEKTKTIAINDQLRDRLRNEKLTAEQRDAINQEIARNEAALIEKQNQLELKRFRLNKAQGISNAIINTAVAVTEVAPNIPLMAFIGALGAAQIATIASQQFTPTASPTPNLTAQGSGGIAAPSFNVVGSSQRNQLAEAVSSALSDKPVKAYVVSSDVSTAQELDRRIVEGASI